MKKLISLFLCAVMLLVPVYVSAQEEVEKPAIMGDINLDGKINASDARLAMRMAASLESTQDVNLLNADVDGNGKLTASDARVILRKSAGLGEFTYGFDENGMSNSLKAIKSDTYVLSVTLDEMHCTIVKNDKDVRILGADIGDELSQMGMEDCGIMYCNNMLYMTYKSKGKDVAMYIPENMYETMGLSMDDVNSLADSISMFIPEDAGIPEKQEIDGEVIYVYSVEDEYGKSRITTDEYGVIRTIDNFNSAGVITDTVVISDVSAQVDDSYFDMSKFEVI